MKIIEKTWGALADGRNTHLFSLENENGLLVTVSDYGGIIQSILTPDRSGRFGDIVLGYDTLKEYESDDCCFGAAIGRCANRIDGASFELGGTLFQLTANEGRNTLHGGSGFHKKLWTPETETNALQLSYISPDGDDGFPGTLKTSIRFTLSEDNVLRMDYDAVSDADTVCSLTGHSYFQLSGHCAEAGNCGTVEGVLLQISADAYTPVDSRNIPTGELLPVQNTLYDFRTERPVGSHALDCNLVIQKEQKPAAQMSDPVSGRTLSLKTSLPGLQLYNGTGITPRSGKGGSLYVPQSGLCLEPQYFPDAVHHPHFPSSVLPAGVRYHHFIEYHFGIL